MNSPETTPTPDRPRSGLALPVVGAIAILLIIYALSPGPVFKYFVATRPPNTSPPSSLNTVYAPLAWANRNVPGVVHFYDWYFELWSIK